MENSIKNTSLYLDEYLQSVQVNSLSIIRDDPGCQRGGLESVVRKMVGGLEDELGQDVLHLDQLPEPAGAGGGHHVSCARHNHFQAAMGSNAGLSGVDKILEVFLIVTFF